VSDVKWANVKIVLLEMEAIKSETQLQKETLRIETFSDGVFCIAVTLLSLEIGVEVKNDTTNTDLFHALINKWPICLAYVISFVNVLLAWIGHHSLFKQLHKTNNSIMITNGVLLMLVALVPFPTKTLGLFLQTGALKTAVIFYTAYFVLISLAFRLLWHAATRKRHLLVHGVTDSQISLTTKNENIGLICNTIILAMAFINPWIALALSFAMWVYWIGFA
jgi:TMEM175 potassium channel family protein